MPNTAMKFETSTAHVRQKLRDFALNNVKKSTPNWWLRLLDRYDNDISFQMKIDWYLFVWVTGISVGILLALVIVYFFLPNHYQQLNTTP